MGDRQVLDVSAIWQQMFKAVVGSTVALGQAQQASITAALRSLELMTHTYARLWGIQTEDAPSAPADKRFSDEAWI